MQTKLVLKQQSALKLRFQPGATGPSGTITIGTVTTGAPGSTADVVNSGTPQHAILDFTIPEGDKGDAATIAVGTVTTGAAGSPAAVTNVGTSGAAVFDFAIPKGDKGDPGDPADTVGVFSDIPTQDLSARSAVRTTGYTTNGDCGAALYRKSASEPAHGAKVQSLDGSWWELAETAPSLQMVGGSDDGTTDNRPALSVAMGYLGASGRILRLPKIGAGIYNFAPAGGVVDLSGITVLADPGVTLRGPISLISSTRASDIAIDYIDDGGLEYKNYRLPSYQGRTIEHKQRWLTIGDLDDRTLTAFDMTAVTAEKLVYSGGDSWTVDTEVTSTADTRTLNLVNDGYARASFVPVRGGDEISIGFWPGTYVRMAFIRHAGGYVSFSANDSAATIRYKSLGSAAVEFPGISWFGLADDPAWAPHKAEWKIRIYDSHTWSLLLNGMEIIAPQAVEWPIADAGFGMYGLDTYTASMSYLTKVRRSEPGGRAPARILCVGDSITTDIVGGWTYAMKETIDGSLGMRVWDVFNQAVPGHTSAQQLAVLNANDAQLTISTHVVIDVGTNDNQDSGPATTLTNVGAMIDRIVSRDVPASHIVICVPHLWYTKTMAGGAGATVGFNDTHALLRAGLKRLAAARGCRLVDFQEVLAAITPQDLARPLQVDPIVRDNLHPTLYGYRAMGEAVAREVLSSSARRMTQKMSTTLLHDAWLQNGWTRESGRPASISVSADGIVSLSGVLNKGTVTTYVTVAILPVNLRPVMTREYAARTNTGSPTTVFVSPDGQILLAEFPVEALFVSLDNISFPLA